MHQEIPSPMPPPITTPPLSRPPPITTPPPLVYTPPMITTTTEEAPGETVDEPEEASDTEEEVEEAAPSAPSLLSKPLPSTFPLQKPQNPTFPQFVANDDSVKPPGPLKQMVKLSPNKNPPNKFFKSPNKVNPKASETGPHPPSKLPPKLEQAATNNQSNNQSNNQTENPFKSLLKIPRGNGSNPTSPTTPVNPGPLKLPPLKDSTKLKASQPKNKMVAKVSTQANPNTNQNLPTKIPPPINIATLPPPISNPPPNASLPLPANIPPPISNLPANIPPPISNPPNNDTQTPAKKVLINPNAFKLPPPGQTPLKPVSVKGGPQKAIKLAPAKLNGEEGSTENSNAVKRPIKKQPPFKSTEKQPTFKNFKAEKEENGEANPIPAKKIGGAPKKFVLPAPVKKEPESAENANPSPFKQPIKKNPVKTFPKKVIN